MIPEHIFGTLGCFYFVSVPHDRLSPHPESLQIKVDAELGT